MQRLPHVLSTVLFLLKTHKRDKLDMLLVTMTYVARHVEGTLIGCN